jgi:hypothetical protein
MTEPTNLRDLVREVLATSNEVDPAALAREVFDRIPQADRELALEQALPIVVRNIVSRQRIHNFPGGHRGNEAQPVLAAGEPVIRDGFPSRKVQAVREAWRLRLRERISVGPGSKEWTFLGDATAEQLDYAAGLRESLAAANAESARQLRDLAAAIRAAGVGSVKDLPDVAERLSA